MKLSIIIPVFNEERTITQTLDHLYSIAIPHVTTEIIIVDDGSTDATRFKISSFASDSTKVSRAKKTIEDKQNSKLKNVKVFHHKANYGKGQAVRTGIKYAEGDYILIQDADAEYNPEDISRLIFPIQKGKTQVVYGTRLTRDR